MGMMQNEEYIELGLLYARESNLAAALKSLNTALLKYAGLENPNAQVSPRVLEQVPLELLSYYGLCLALVQGRVDEGIRLCRRALAKDTLRPDFYLNLGKVYMKANLKAKALKVFQRGLEVSEKNRELINEIKRMGIRRKRPLGFLPRDHFLNRYSGLLLRRLGIEGRPEIPYFGRDSVQ